MSLPTTTKERIVRIVTNHVLRDLPKPLTNTPNVVIVDKIVSILDEIETAVDTAIHSQIVAESQQTPKKHTHRWWE